MRLIARKLLLRLDPLIHEPLCYLANILKSIYTPTNIQASKPLIIRPGGLGDLVLVTLALKQLGLDAKKYNWLIESRSKPWADFLDLDYLCYDKKPVSTLFKLFGKHPIIINTEQRNGLTQFIGLFSKSKNATLYSFSSVRSAKFSNVKVEYNLYDLHETENFRNLFKTSLAAQDKISTKVQNINLDNNSSELLVAVSGLEVNYKKIDFLTWKELIKKWSNNQKFTICYAPNDIHFARMLHAEFPEKSRLFKGNFNELINKIKHANDLLAIDSGLVHIASYFDKKSTVIFTASREKKWGPLNKNSRLILRNDIECRPCTIFSQVKNCNYNYRCKDLEYERDVITINK